jgi:enoyl-CoA hydratase/carnithine racemase
LAIVNYERDGNVAIISMNRPEKLNALSKALNDGLEEAWEKFEHDDKVKVGILRGEGGSFCAGADLVEFKEHPPGSSIPDPDRERYRRPWALSKPLICAAQGWSVGAGSILMVSCDLVIAAESLKIWYSEMIRGLTPIAAKYIVNQIPLLFINQLVYEAEPIDAQTALRMGFVNRVVPDDKLMDAAMRSARRVASMPIHGLVLYKKFVRKAVELPDTAYYQVSLNRALSAPHQDVAIAGLEAWAERKQFSDGGGAEYPLPEEFNRTEV